MDDAEVIRQMLEQAEEELVAAREERDRLNRRIREVLLPRAERARRAANIYRWEIERRQQQQQQEEE